MKRRLELLAPGGDVDSIKAAIYAGANAVFCGLNKFNARNRAANIGFEELQGILRLAHNKQCQVFLTLNVVVLDSEVPALIKLLNRLVHTSIDGVIVQDLGLFHILRTHFPSLHIHASTQTTTHNRGQLQFLKHLGAERVNLSRELNISEIIHLTELAHQQDVEVEVFVHGSYCISFSGICYMSSLQSGNSGNKGRCSQPCRDKYKTTNQGKDYPLNLKDNSAFFDLDKLYEAKVDSLKIEGRIKDYDYVYTTVNAWRKQLNHFSESGTLLKDNSQLYRVFNRDFSNAFLSDNKGKDMYIDNSSSYSTKYFTAPNIGAPNAKHIISTTQLFDEKEQLKQDLKQAIDQYDISSIPLKMIFSGEVGEALTIRVEAQGLSFALTSAIVLVDKGTLPLDYDMLYKRFKTINDTAYTIGDLSVECGEDTYLSFKELNKLKKQLLIRLMPNNKLYPEVVLPKLKRSYDYTAQKKMAILISNEEDLTTLDLSSKQVFFQLPSCFGNQRDYYVELFDKYKELIPWFPAILIGQDFEHAVELLQKVSDRPIVANNTGIAFQAYEQNIEWIAGPQLNITNSYSLIALQDKFNCNSAFLSNELSQQQVASIRKPEDFYLYYSVYHPLELLTSRQCLFLQTSGCHKTHMDDECLSECKKNSSITNLKGESFKLRKIPGYHHSLFNDSYYLNTEVVTDFPNLFSTYFADFRDIAEHSSTDKASVLSNIESAIGGDVSSMSSPLHDMLAPTTNKQYRKGI